MFENIATPCHCLSAYLPDTPASDVFSLPSDAAVRVKAFCKRNSLTTRQIDVLLSLLQGRFNKEIAYQLKISEATVKAHAGAIMRLCGCRNRTELVLKALLGGLPASIPAAYPGGE